MLLLLLLLHNSLKTTGKQFISTPAGDRAWFSQVSQNNFEGTCCLHQTCPSVGPGATRVTTGVSKAQNFLDFAGLTRHDLDHFKNDISGFQIT